MIKFALTPMFIITLFVCSCDNGKSFKGAVYKGVPIEEGTDIDSDRFAARESAGFAMYITEMKVPDLTNFYKRVMPEL